MDITETVSVQQENTATTTLEPHCRYDVTIDAAEVISVAAGQVLRVTAHVIDDGPTNGHVTTNEYILANDDIARRRMKSLVMATGVTPDDNGGFRITALGGTSLSIEIQDDGTWCDEIALVPALVPDGMPGSPRPIADPYEAANGIISVHRLDRSDVLASFDARITSEIVLDDGMAQKRRYRIEALLSDGAVAPAFAIDASDFARMDWVAEHLGARAIIAAGNKRRDELREAIQRLSLPTQRLMYCHTGWRQVDGRWAYLHSGGAIGAADVSIQLDPPLDRIKLPSTVENLKDAVQWSAKLLDAGPASVTVPLVGATYLAPLAAIVEIDFLLWLLGISGSLKSELAALVQTHFGSFSRKSLPASWLSTANSIEAILFAAKDALVVIDDYAPQADPASQRDLQRVAAHIVRAIGNRASRGRLRSDLTRHPDRPPRGLAIATGEQLPLGSSIEARLVPVEVDRGLLDLKMISSIQQHTDRLPHTLAGYIAWLAPQIDRLKNELPRRKLELRDELQTGGHARQPEALAQLAIGMEMFLRFVVDIGVFDQATATKWWETTLSALRSLGRREARHQRASDPGQQFLAVLRTLRAQGRIVLVHKDAAPSTSADDPNHIPVGKWFVGWRDHDTAYLDPKAARRSVVEFLRESGETWPHTTRALHDALLRGGYLIVAAPKDGERPEPVPQRRIGGKVRRVLQIPLRFLDEDVEHGEEVVDA